MDPVLSPRARLTLGWGTGVYFPLDLYGPHIPRASESRKQENTVNVTGSVMGIEHRVSPSAKVWAPGVTAGSPT